MNVVFWCVYCRPPRDRCRAGGPAHQARPPLARHPRPATVAKLYGPHSARVPASLRRIARVAAPMAASVRGAAAAALGLVLLLHVAAPASGLNFKIAPKEELCFHEITHKGNKVLAFFDVLSWGYGAYVYLYVNAPSGRELQKFEAESEGRVEFTATEDGEHSFCFKNAYTETEVSFWVNTETDVALADVAKEGRLTACLRPAARVFLFFVLLPLQLLTTVFLRPRPPSLTTLFFLFCPPPVLCRARERYGVQRGEAQRPRRRSARRSRGVQVARAAPPPEYVARPFSSHAACDSPFFLLLTPERAGKEVLTSYSCCFPVSRGTLLHFR